MDIILFVKARSNLCICSSKKIIIKGFMYLFIYFHLWSAPIIRAWKIHVFVTCNPANAYNILLCNFTIILLLIYIPFSLNIN